VSFLDMLAMRFPMHELLNRGRSGETVISLYRRLAQHGVPNDTHAAILWVGVNDVLAEVSHSHFLLKRWMRQPPARSEAEFRDHYLRILELLLEQTMHVLAVAPFLIGEDLSNPWNRRLADLGQVISATASSFARVSHLDLREEISSLLPAKGSSSYVPTGVLGIARDVILLRSPGRVDEMAARRGLRLTLDGVHLNSRGAGIAAEAFSDVIERFSG